MYNFKTVPFEGYVNFSFLGDMPSKIRASGIGNSKCACLDNCHNKTAG
jgi:hypothetical protein